METTANGYKFVINNEGYVEAYSEEAGSESSPKPLFISKHKVSNKREFEIEVSYIINDNL